MATFLELKGLMTNSDLQDKVQVALIIGVQTILDGTPTASEQAYAAHVFSGNSETTKALASILAQNKDATVAQITGATDATIETQVAGVIDTLSAAFNAV